MALTIEIYVSASGVADAAFTLLTSLPDTGAGFSFDHSPVTPGSLYIYRARRRDSDKAGTDCEYSAWSDLRFCRAPYPKVSKNMCYGDINTGAKSALYIAVESCENIPTRATWRVPYMSGGVERDAQLLYSVELQDTLDMYTDVVEGIVQYQGSVTLQIRPEGAFPRFMLAAFSHTATVIAQPVSHFRHRFFIGKGPKTVTLIQRKGDTLFVYPGTTVSSFNVSFSKQQDTVLQATFSVMSLNELVYELDLVPDAAALLSTATASADPLPPYSPVKGKAYINNLIAGIKDMSWDITPNKERDQVFDGNRGARRIFTNGRTSVTGSASLNYADNTNVRRELLGPDVPTGAYGIGDKIAVAPVGIVFEPPANGAGFSNRLSFQAPTTTIKTTQPIDGDGVIPENLTFAPMNRTGNTANTSWYCEIDNSESGTSLLTPGTPITSVPNNRATDYDYGIASGTPTTTVISSTSTQLSDVDDYYNGFTFLVLTGTQAGQKAVVLDYVESTKTVTLATALPGAMAAGDGFDMKP